MRYLDRDRVNEMMLLQWRASYRLIPAVSNERIGMRTQLVRDDDVIALLNRSRTRTQPFVESVIVLVDAERLEKETGVPAAKIVKLARREKNPIPAFRLTERVTRFDLATARDWILGKRKVA